MPLPGIQTRAKVQSLRRRTGFSPPGFACILRRKAPHPLRGRQKDEFRDIETVVIELLSGNIVFLLLAALLIAVVVKGVKIVPQSEKYVIERFGRLRSVLGPGINLIVPFIDRVAHEISILERQLPNASQDAITKDNVLVQVETSVFYRITEPERTVYRIRDVDAAIATNA